MKKTIVALFLSLMPLLAMESKAPEVEMYPDEMPKSKLAFTLDLSKGHEWEDTRDYGEVILHRRLSQTCKEIEKILSYSQLRKHSSSFSFNKNQEADLYGKEDPNNLKPMLLDTHISLDDNLSFIPTLNSVRTNPLLNHKDKWKTVKVLREIAKEKYKVEFPYDKSDYETTIEFAKEMSWKYVNLSLNKLNGFVCCDDICMQLYKNIDSTSLQESIVRAAVVVNNKFYFSFYSLYDTEKELQETSRYLKKFIN